MRSILGLKLNNGMLLHIVGDFPNKELARVVAIQMSNNFIDDKNRQLKPDCKIETSESWAQDKKISYQSGNYIYIVTFVYNGVPYNVNMLGNGIKGVYNNIKLQYGISENIPMLIFKTNQVVKKASAMTKSRTLIRDNKQLKELLKAAEKKAFGSPQMSMYMQHLKIMVALINDFKSSKYLKISADKLIEFVAAIIKYVYPDKYDLDINSQTVSTDETTGLCWVLNMLDIDIKNYYNWISQDSGGDGEMIPV